MIDVAIIGSNLEAVSVALNLCARGKSVILLTGYETSLSNLEIVAMQQNYSKIQMSELLTKLYYKLKHEYSVVPFSGLISRVSKFGDGIMIHVSDEIFEVSTVLLTGDALDYEQIPGEFQFYRKGVSYTPEADAARYEYKTAILYGEAYHSVTKANILKSRGVEVIFVSKKYGFGLSNGIDLVKGKLKEIAGQEHMKYAVVDSKKIHADVLFIVRDYMPIKSMVSGLQIDDNQRPIVDENYMTNIKHIFSISPNTYHTQSVPDRVSRALEVSKIIANTI